jgi:hypothetical protein
MQSFYKDLVARDSSPQETPRPAKARFNSAHIWNTCQRCRHVQYDEAARRVSEISTGGGRMSILTVMRVEKVLIEDREEKGN